MIIFVDNLEDNVEASIINELDLQSGIISIGNYHTHLPISCLEYREEHGNSLVKIEFTKTDSEVHFGITDEYGKTYSLIATEEDMEHPAIQREIAIIKTLSKTPQMTSTRLVEILKSDHPIDWDGCNALTGLNIIAKYLPKSGIEYSEHDIIFAATISDILEAGITEEDALKLRKLNWMIDETGTGLACFV